jgi:hypothetical protein
MPIFKRIGGRGWRLERFKFGVYLVVPVVAVLLYSLPSVHEAAIRGSRYIVYVPSDTGGGARERAAGPGR